MGLRENWSISSQDLGTLGSKRPSSCTLERTHGSPPGASLRLGTSKALEEGMKLGSKNKRLASVDSPVA